MIAAIAQNEIRLLSRNGVFVFLIITMIALMTGASALSVQRLNTFERERSAAELVDREVWNNQGERNPHAAAHFSRYAFKPIPGLAAFDPGVTDYAGLALWMEAHHQNPAVFRRAEDLGDLGGHSGLSPAWILQYAAPIFIFLVLFSAVAGERELGTQKQLIASGVTARAWLVGKFIGAGFSVGAIVLPAVLLGYLIVGNSDAQPLPDTGRRVAGLSIVYGIYFIAISAFSIGVSAITRDKRTAFTVLIAVWAIAFILVPRLSGSIAGVLYPTPESISITDDLRDASMAYYVDEDVQDQLQRTILEEYGVQSTDDLPFDYSGYTLQYSEEYSHPLFAEVYRGLDETFVRQERVLAAASILSPVLALETLSAGFSGTDRLHHDSFRQAAEERRRVIVKQLNDDLTQNAKDGPYMADEALWRQVGDFEHQLPSMDQFSGKYAFSIIVLVFYAVASVLFGYVAVRSSQKESAA